MEDKRRFKRYLVEGIHGKMLFASEVNILNISMGGAAVEADKRLNMNCEYTLKLHNDKDTLLLKGKVVWSTISRSRLSGEGEAVPVYHAGLKFSNVLEEKAEQLRGFLDRHKTEGETEASITVDPDSRVSGLRFIIDSAHAAILDYPFNYRVKKISLGGMLIESDAEFKVEDHLDLEIFLKENIPVGFKGRVASCIPLNAGEPTAFDVGIEFVEVSDEGRAALQEFITSLG